MTDDQEPGVVAVWHESSAIGRHFEELLVDGTVLTWTEPPIGETDHPGEDDPGHNPVCDCPHTPMQFCRVCAGCAACRQCSGPHVWPAPVN
ncbi:hypothetical protein [Streptomyces triculaminicus]|uniref:hypothetical protein n=1 Tax=Streptomyces triculaminicus TaxID=2816232 RepID=UPI0037D25B73